MAKEVAPSSGTKEKGPARGSGSVKGLEEELIGLGLLRQDLSCFRGSFRTLRIELKATHVTKYISGAERSTLDRFADHFLEVYGASFFPVFTNDAVHEPRQYQSQQEKIRFKIVELCVKQNKYLKQNTAGRGSVGTTAPSSYSSPHDPRLSSLSSTEQRSPYYTRSSVARQPNLMRETGSRSVSMEFSSGDSPVVHSVSAPGLTSLPRSGMQIETEPGPDQIRIAKRRRLESDQPLNTEDRHQTSRTSQLSCNASATTTPKWVTGAISDTTDPSVQQSGLVPSPSQGSVDKLLAAAAAAANEMHLSQDRPDAFEAEAIDQLDSSLSGQASFPVITSTEHPPCPPVESAAEDNRTSGAIHTSAASGLPTFTASCAPTGTPPVTTLARRPTTAVMMPPPPRRIPPIKRVPQLRKRTRFHTEDPEELHKTKHSSRDSLVQRREAAFAVPVGNRPISEIINLSTPSLSTPPPPPPPPSSASPPPPPPSVPPPAPPLSRSLPPAAPPAHTQTQSSAPAQREGGEMRPLQISCSLSYHQDKEQVSRQWTPPDGNFLNKSVEDVLRAMRFPAGHRVTASSGLRLRFSPLEGSLEGKLLTGTIAVDEMAFRMQMTDFERMVSGLRRRGGVEPLPIAMRIEWLDDKEQ